MAETPIEILIVDDNPGDVLLTKEALRDALILNQVHVASDGAVALAFLKREGVHRDAPIPDIVFLDLGMPRVDGFQVLAEMKADPELRRIPVIVMSSSDAESDLARAYDAQIAGYLVKPIDLDSYFSAIRAIKEFWFNVVTLAPKARKASS
jgi:two-component system, chemotaxis family, response regulator Rcp1